MKPSIPTTRKTILAFLLFSCVLSSVAQKEPKNDFYVFDANWKPTNAANSVYFIVITPSDSGFEWDYYNNSGPLVRVETHSTHDGLDLNGPVCLYTKSGDIDSIGQYQHSKKEGSFYKYGIASNGERTWKTEYIYVADSLVEVKDKMAEAEERIREDSAEKRNPGAATAKQTPNPPLTRAQLLSMPVDSSLEIESSFPGGLRAWQKFLTHTLRYPEEAVTRRLMGEIDIWFYVDTTGKTGGHFVFHSANFWLDREALRVLRKSGEWIPAYQHGHLVKSYKKQPISMRLQ